MLVITVTTVIVVVAAATAASASSSRSSSPSSSSRAAAATAALEKDHINDYDDIFVQNEAYSKFYDYDNNDDDYDDDDDDDDDENENENDEDILNDRYQRDYNGRRRRYQRGSSTGIRRKRYPGKNISGNDGINKSRRQRRTR